MSTRTTQCNTTLRQSELKSVIPAFLREYTLFNALTNYRHLPPRKKRKKRKKRMRKKRTRKKKRKK
jgi:hypothetical protein